MRSSFMTKRETKYLTLTWCQRLRCNHRQITRLFLLSKARIKDLPFNQKLFPGQIFIKTLKYSNKFQLWHSELGSYIPRMFFQRINISHGQVSKALVMLYSCWSILFQIYLSYIQPDLACWRGVIFKLLNTQHSTYKSIGRHKSGWRLKRSSNL